MIFHVSLIASLITYIVLIALMILQIVETKRFGEPVAWILFGAHGAVMIAWFLVDAIDAQFNAHFYNGWSNAVHLQGMCRMMFAQRSSNTVVFRYVNF